MNEGNNMKYIIGLDVGITSVGWAVINSDKNRIENLGVRLFSAAEKPKDGGSLNAERREARGLRRRLRRRRIRMMKIKELFLKYMLLKKEELDKLYILNSDDIDTWMLRAEGLNRKLTNREWARVLTAIAKRRGYKSNRKSEETSNEDKVLLNATIKNMEYMQDKDYRTVGEMFALDSKYKDAKRNKSGKYENCITRQLLENEIHVLFECQRSFGNEFASNQFEEEYVQVFLWQKQFLTDELMYKMIGKCTFEPDELRAAKNSWSFERFMLLQKVNNLVYTADGIEYPLNDIERSKIIELAYSMKTGVKYTRIRKELSLPEDARFNMLNYYVNPKKKEAEELTEEAIVKKAEDTVFVELNGYHKLRSAFEKSGLEEEWNEFSANHNLLDEVAFILSKCKTDEDIRENLNRINLEDRIIACLLDVNFSKFGHLSTKAINKILPYLEAGMKYDKATTEAGYNFKNDDKNPNYKLPKIDFEDIRNPVVYRALTQTRKVINAIIDRYGSPFEIHVEVARDLSKSFSERGKIAKKQQENKAENDKSIAYLKETFKLDTPKPVDILKLKLYREQQGKSAYSLHEIECNRLFEDDYVEIDHAIPFSRSFDNSYNNKVLVFSKENQEKRNKTPYEYLSETSIWESFEAWVKSTYRTNAKKRNNLLVKNYNEEKESSWLERNLNDTRYIARYIVNYVKNNLHFEDFGEKSNRMRVKTIEGAATTALRNYWGISSKNREESDLHHAVDAVIIAAATQASINKIREYSKQRELYYRKGEDGEYYDSETKQKADVKYKDHYMNRPWPKFTEEIEARISQNPSLALKSFTNYDDVDIEKIKPIFVSRMPRRKATGAAHKDTIYSNTDKNAEYVTVKKNLSTISKDEITAIVTDERYINLYRSEKEIYDEIYNRMKHFDFKAEKAFTKEDFPIRKKAKNGERTYCKKC